MKLTSSVSSLLFLLLSLVFASDLIVIKFGLRTSPPLSFAGLRYLFAGLVMLPIMTVFRSSRSIGRKGLVIAAFLGSLAAIEFACLYTGMQYISAGESSIFYYTNPLFVALLASAFLKEPFSWKKLFALTFGFAGVVLLFLENVSTRSLSLGGVLVLSGAFVWAIGIVLFKKLLENENSLPVTSTLLLSAGTILLISSVFRESTPVLSPQLITTLAYLVLVCSAFGITLYYYLLRNHEATEVSTWLFLVPVLGVLLGWLLLGEEVSLNEVIGILCVGTGILILNK